MSFHTKFEQEGGNHLPDFGTSFVPLKPGTKQPSMVGWQGKPVSRADIGVHINNGRNVGLLLGERTGFVDIDCDCREAVVIAEAILPKPYASFSRNEVSAHYIYRCSSEVMATVRRQGSEGTIIELRGTGAQTMIPPSTHPDGDKLDWFEVDREATYQDFDELIRLTSVIAAGALVSNCWREGVRHELANAFAGILRKSGVSHDTAEAVVAEICDLKSDEEKRDRLRAVDDTYNATLDRVSGITALGGILIPADSQKINEWLFGLRDVATHSDANEDRVKILDDIPSEYRMAQAFSRNARDRAAYVPEEKQWYLWDGRIWKKDDRGQVMDMFQSFVDQVQIQSNRNIASESEKFKSLAKTKNCLEFAQASLGKNRVEFDANPNFFGCQNGVYDLKAMEFRDGKPDDFLTLSTGTVYCPDAECPHFQRFVSDICNQDGGKAAYIQRVFGYSLYGENPEQCLFIFHGGGANGKSTLMNAMRGVLGTYAKTAPMSVLIQDSGRSVGDDIMHLRGARLIAASESDAGQALAEAKIKQITGSEPVTARLLYSNWQEVLINGTICLSTNNLPRIAGTDEGIRRRIRVVEFTRTFKAGEQDHDLKDKLKEEYPGILNWALEGYRDWKAKGLDEPASVRSATDAYFQQNDTIGQFIEECCALDRASSATLAEMRVAYTQWCQSHGVRPEAPSQFNAYLTNRLGLSQGRTNIGRFWSGVRLTADLDRFR